MAVEANLNLLLLANALAAASGLAALLAGKRGESAPRAANAVLAAGCALGLAGALPALIGPAAVLLLPGLGLGEGMRLGLDALSALFLVPVYLIGACVSLYGLAYWRQAAHPESSRKLRLFYGLEIAALAQVALARDALSFLIAWEVMALAGYFLITTESDDAEASRAGWHYLVYTHGGTLALVGLFALLGAVTGSAAFPETLLPATGALPTAIFALAVAGFGAKAGVMPLHSWLPGAHASAPSHVSALLSGVLLKMGIYGILRITGLFSDPPYFWGLTLFGLGLVTSLLGVAFALAQHDLKRLLAYHSIENIGIIILGIGVALLGRSTGRPEWILLGLGGALLHVWNHALFKPLLFFGAGAVIQAAGTREIDRTGGLAKRMPATAALFLIGAVAICGLPPLNGFVSELLIYLGLFRTALAAQPTSWLFGLLGAPVLAMTGALALACFVKVYGVVFLGSPRSGLGARASDPPASMLAPMVVTAAACVAIGVLPWLAAPLVEGAIAAWNPGSAGAVLPAPGLVDLAPLHALSAVAAGLLALAALAAMTALPLRPGLRRAIDRGRPTWDCGYLGAGSRSGRLQYTGASFAGSLVGLLRFALRPKVDRSVLSGPFPAAASYASHVGDPVLKLFLAVARAIHRACSALRILQHGPVQRQLLYVLATVVVLLLLSFWK